jgi:hypothetical protein
MSFSLRRTQARPRAICSWENEGGALVAPLNGTGQPHIESIPTAAYVPYRTKWISIKTRDRSAG